MAISFVKPERRLVLKCEVQRDYHVDAMVRVMRKDGMEVSNVKQGNVRVITVQPEFKNLIFLTPRFDC